MKETFPDNQLVEFLRRSYFVVDGLWFVKTEEKHGFDKAMELDEAIWEIMPKIQARKAKALLEIDTGGIANLCRAFQLKLTCEGFEFDAEADDHKATFTISKCPWYEALKASDRTHIADTIADRICAREYAGWAREFGPGIGYKPQGRLCVQSEHCEQCVISFIKD